MSDQWKNGGPTETTRLLADSVRTARENEQIAQRTTEEVMEQGETLQDARDKVDSINDMSTAARSAVRAIRLRVFNRKIQLWICIILLFIIDSYLIVKMYNNHGSLW